MRRILLAGASGHLGREVTRRFVEAGYRVRALTRAPERLAHLREHLDEVVRADFTDPASLAGACEDTQLVFSCAGASLSLNDLRDRRSYMEVDYRGNLNLLEGASCSTPSTPPRTNASWTRCAPPVSPAR